MARVVLFQAHKLLISMGIGLGLLLLVYGIVQFKRTADGWSLATGIGGAIACVCLAAYLRWFVRKRAREAAR